MIRRCLLILPVLLIAACDTSGSDSEDLGDLSQDPAALVGTWDLAFSTPSGEWGTPTKTPVSALGYTRTYVFDADGQAEVYASGELVRSGPYELRTVPYRDGSGRTTRWLSIDGDSGDWFGIRGDRLYFDYRAMDGDLQEYHRR